MMPSSHDLQVKDLGELGLLQRLQPFCPPGMMDDDAALLAIASDQSAVITTDVLVDGVHFSDRTTSPRDVGWRATAANLSDLAAMGADPLGITIGLGLTGEVQVAWIDELYQGMADCLDRFGGVILGGDVCRAPVITLAITAVGQVVPQQAIRRTVAQPDQAIVVTGVHGAAQAGLELLLHPEIGASLSDAERACLIQAHQRPQPRFDVLKTLRQLQTSQSAVPIAGMDSSDGLANAVLQICRASGVGAWIERSQISLPPEFDAWLSPQQSLDWALYGGEDFELVLCLPSALAIRLVEQLGPNAAMIGQITADPTVELRDQASGSSEMLDFQRGFQHFS